MKAGLLAHLASLKKKTDEEKTVITATVITAEDLRDPVLYHKFVAQRKAAHEPIPPGNHIGQAGHHWLKRNPQLSGSGDAGEWIVAQWSPSQLLWYRSNELATTELALYGGGRMGHWEWKGHIPLPDL